MLHHHVSTNSMRTCRVLCHLKAKAAALPVAVWLVLLLKGYYGTSERGVTAVLAAHVTTDSEGEDQLVA